MAPRAPAPVTGPTLPRKGHVIRAPVKPALPCLVILVHGVNDLGEAYAAQESGLLAGLNRRLHRNDLQPAHYHLPPARDDPDAAAQRERQTLLADPDAVYYRRTVDPASAWNPVIPFYWGSRTSDPPRTLNHLRVDRFGNRVDANGAKGGGHVANATNNLLDMWGPGFQQTLYKLVDLNACADQPTHPLLDAGNRRYMVLAALRLAMLVQMIRERTPQTVVNLIAHSQGCMLSLLAQALLARKGQRPADCLILNHPPYGLEESVFDRQTHDHPKAAHARLETLVRLVGLVTAAPQATPALATLLDPVHNGGLTGGPPDPRYADRDNRGRVFLYFCPEDATVGLKTIQGIGWQGVPEHSHGRPALAALGPRFHQRVWTRRSRRGRVPRVGEDTRYVLLEKGEDFWSYNRSSAFCATPGRNEVRILATDVPLPAPVAPNLTYGESRNHPGFLDVGPCDAATAITNGGRDKTNHAETGSAIACHRSRNDVDDVRPRYGSIHLDPGERQELERRLNAGRSDLDQIKVNFAKRIGHGKLYVEYQESANEARLRWQTQERDANSYHSAIVTNPDHSAQVTAWDLAIGPACVYQEDQGSGEEMGWVEKTQNFIAYLTALADWRMTPGDLQKLQDDQNQSQFLKHDVHHHKLIIAASIYYQKGILSEDLLPNTDVILS